MGLMTGSEGLLGVVTEVTVRILRKPPAARGLLLGFASVEAGARCVGAIIARGIIPGGLEMMDKATIDAVERFQPCGYPLDAAALVIVELDGTAAEVDHARRRRRANRARGGRDDDEGFDQRGRAAAILGRAQKRLSGGELHRPRLSLHGRHDPARTAARRC